MAWKPPSAVPDTTWMPPSAVADNTNVGGTPVDTKAVGRQNASDIGDFAMNSVPPAMSGLGAGIGLLTSPVTGPAGPLMGATLGWGVGGEIKRQQQSAMGQPTPQGMDRMKAVRNDLYSGLASEGLGQLGSLGAKSLAKGAMRSALSPTGKQLLRNPNLIPEAIANKTTVGGAGPLSKILGGGAKSEWDKVWASDAQLEPMLQEAKANGWGKTSESYRPAMEKYIKDKVQGKSAHWQDRANEIRLWFQKFVDQNMGGGQDEAGFIGPKTPMPLGAPETNVLKQGEMREGTPFYNKKMEGLVAPSTIREQKFHAAVGTILKNSLEDIPGVAGRNKLTGSLIRTAGAATRAEGLKTPLQTRVMEGLAGGMGALVPSGGGAAGRAGDAAAAYFLSHAALSPWTMSRAALALHYGLAPAMRVAPYAAIGAFQPALNDRGY